MKQRGYVSCVAIMLGGIVLLSTSSLASDKYQPGKQFADSLKGSGVGHLQGFKPEVVIPNYNANPPETGHYGGVTSSGSAGLESAGAGQLNTSEVGKVTTEVIMNRPKDPISMDAPFVSGGFDIQDKADTVTNGVVDKCETVNVGKTEITTHHCERETAVELSCTRKASIKENMTTITVAKTVTVSVTLVHQQGDSWQGTLVSPLAGRLVKVSIEGGDMPIPYTAICGYGSDYECKKSISESLSLMGKTFPISVVKYPYLYTQCSGGNNTHCREYRNDGVGRIQQTFAIDQQITSGQSFAMVKRSKERFWSRLPAVTVTVTLTIEVQETTAKPEVVWVETCPFDKSEEVLQSETCTEAGETKTVVVAGVSYPVYSACWAYKDIYVSQDGDNGACGKYMSDTACTVSKTTCVELLGAVCLREQAVFTCEKKISGEAQLCSGQLVCANGECDQLENNKTNSFGKAVSALAAVTAAAKDVSDLNGVDVRAFTGEKKECRMAIAGFNNCCKDSGWGQGIGLAHCDSEEKALGKAKEKQLTVSVGTYCSKKVLGVCLQKKKAYCQFDSKLAQIVQAQGRKGQLGINFGSGKSPNCRGITIDELQALRFDNMDFSNFYSDLDAGTTVPADSELADRVKAQIEAALQQAAGKGGAR